MNFPKYLFITFLFLFNFTSGQEIKFKHLSVEDGLSRSYVNSMIEDRIGFLWFGTQDGLNRFDGYQFKVFRNDPENEYSISDNNIWSLFEDKSGNIWAGSQNGILNCFNPQTEKFKRYILDSTSAIGSNSITSLFQDRKGKLWIGTYKNGLYQLDINSGVIKHWQHNPENKNSLSNKFVTAIIEDFKGNLWIGTYNGLCLLKNDSLNYFDRFYNNPSGSNSLSHNTIWTFFKSDKDSNHIWAGTYNGLTKIEVNKKKLEAVVPDKDNPDPFSRSISSICPEGTKDNVFWIGTYGGLLKLDLTSNKFTRWVNQPDNPASLSNNLINKVLIDRSGVMWIVTQKGINYYSYQKDQFSFYSKQKYEGIDLSELTGSDVQAICESHNEIIWVGCSMDLFSINKSANTFQLKKHPQFAGQNIWGLAPGNSNDIWIGTYGNGLSNLNLSTGKLQHWSGDRNDPENISNAYVRAIHQDKSGFVWIGLWGVGLNRLDPKTGIVTKWHHDKDNPNSLIYDDVWAIFEDSAGRIWIGTYGGGLNLFDSTDGGIFHKWTENSPDGERLCSNNILSIFESKKNNSSSKTVLWIGTTNGLNRFSIDKNLLSKEGDLKVDIKHYFSHSEFAFNVINSIGEDNEGHLWITTNNGLIEFDPVSERIINKYSTYDGLLSNEFNPNSVCRTKNGEMFIGSINGLNVFHPDSIKHSNYISPVVLTDFQVFNQQVTVGSDSPLKSSIQTADKIALPYNQNVFSFQFASLDYNAPEMNQYAYMMEGFDKDWIYSGSRRFITYTNLDPGEYIFRVKATNSDGIWNEKGREIAIIIAPPFWATWWFRGLIFILLLGILYSLYRIRLKRILEIERLRIKIASDLHDDIGAGLTRISLESELLKSNSNSNSEERHSAVQRIGNMSREIITSMSDVVWSIDARNDSIESLINHMKDFSFSLFSARNGQVHFEIDNLELQKKLKVDIRQNIYLIFKEAINNAAKYSDSDIIKVSMKNINGQFIMNIQDSGSTFNKEKLSGHGLRNMQMRAERINGKIDFVKEDGFKVKLITEEL